jgi:amino-acid N-acetyltransferase
MVVTAPWRDRGLGTALGQHLIQSASDPLYLECMSRLVPFYEKLGFEPVEWQQVPESLKWKFGVSQLGSKLLPISVTLMRYRRD